MTGAGMYCHHRGQKKKGDRVAWATAESKQEGIGRVQESITNCRGTSPNATKGLATVGR